MRKGTMSHIKIKEIMERNLEKCQICLGRKALVHVQSSAWREEKLSRIQGDLVIESSRPRTDS